MPKKKFVLRIDEKTMDAVEKWASDEFRSVNGQLEFIITRALKEKKGWPETGFKPDGGKSLRTLFATATEAVKFGAVSYLPKPADVDDILKAFSQNTELPIPEAEEDFQAPSLARMEWEHINRVLHDCKGNISAAAKKLGLHRRTLQRKLNKYPPDN